MIPLKTISKATIPGSGRLGGKSQESFASYMDRQLNDAGSEKNLLGVKAPKAEGGERQVVEKGKDSDSDDALNAATLLAQFLQDLKGMAKDVDKTPGDWSFSVPDNGMLEKIAADAGMDENALASLLQQASGQDGVFDLNKFLATLTQHFEEQGDSVEVKVPETDLPFFETLLSKLGVPVEQIVDAADQGATGDGQLDLTAFVESLQDVQDNGQPIVLSDWEISQLREVLSKAGVDDQLQNRLLPEQGVNSNSNSNSNTANNSGTPLTLASLRDMLQQGVANVKDSRPKLDLPAFLTDLQQVFTEAKFSDKNVGWSPAVQEAVSATYQELLKSVDLSTVQAKTVSAKNVSATVKTPGQSATMVEDESLDLHGLTDVVDPEGENAVAAAKAEGSVGKGEMVGQGQIPGQSATVVEGSAVALSLEGHAAAAAAAGHHVGSEHQMAVEPGRMADMHAPGMRQEVAQQTFHNISNSVLNGLKNNEHHLVLRLYPRELGEVKVEMTVRDQNVTLSFGMENHRVKETLESNMQQFQDNLAKQGFNLQGCEVSVGQQQEDPSAAWQSFEQNRQQQGQGAGGRETLADLPAESMYIRPMSGADREGGISLFI